MRTHLLAASFFLLPPATSAFAQAGTVIDRVGSAVVTRVKGSTVRIARPLGPTSKGSTLILDWVLVTDSTLGIVFDGPTGVTGLFTDPWYRYQALMRMRALVPIQAFEVRILTFNVWHEFTGLLSLSQLEDFQTGDQKPFYRTWGYYGESQVSDLLTSISYVAKVRLADGTIIVADPTPALKAAQAIQASVTLQDLQPTREPVPPAARTQT